MNSSPLYPIIKLRKGKDEAVKRFHPWIFSGAIAKMETGIMEGDLVNVVDENGDIIGYIDENGILHEKQ